MTTIDEERDRLRRVAYDGTTCRCCSQTVKAYKRKVTASMAYMLIRMYRAGGTDYVKLTELRDGNGSMDTTITKYFGLIEEERTRREDGGRAGWWRVTELGERFIRGEAAVAKYAHVYRDQCFKFSGAEVDVRSALGTKFRYDELMAGV